MEIAHPGGARPTGVKLSRPKPLVVPILRAGLGMLDGMVRLLPTARGRLPRHGAQRGDARPRSPTPTGCPTTCPGGSATSWTRCSRPAARSPWPSSYLAERGADDITAITLLAAPEGIAHLEEELADLDVPVTLVTGAVDERLNEHGYIVPGLGDAGDRLYGVV